MKELLREEMPYLFILALLCLFLYIPCLGNRDLWGTVEPQYAEVAREALVDGHWVVPHYNGEVYTIKPPLYPWLIALVSIPVGDVTEFTARLPSALSALGMVLIVYLLGRELFSQRVGMLAALILVSSPHFYKSACMVRIDMPLAFLTTASLAAFYAGLVHSKNSYYLLGWFFAALTALVKGPLTPLMIVLIVFLYLYSSKKLDVVKVNWTILGACVFVATIMVWLLPAYLREGDAYVYALLKWLGQYAEGQISKEGFYYYLPLLFGAGFGPLALLVPIAIYLFYRDKIEGLRLPYIWFAVIFFTFSLIPSKHGRYLLPLYPAMALLAAVPLNRFLERSAPAWPVIKTFPLLMFAMVVGVEVALMESHALPYPALSLVLGALCLLLVVYLALRVGQYRLLFGAIFLLLITFGVSRYQFLLPEENYMRSEKALCEDIVNAMEPGAEWALCSGFIRPAYPFYTRTYPKNLGNVGQLANFFSSKERVYCLVLPEQLKGLEFPVTEVARLKGKGGSEFVLVSNRPKDG